MIVVDGGPVAAHVQAFADEINRRFGFTHIMTYPGHEPDQQHALDNFHTRDKMLALAQWCTRDDVIDVYGIDYVIFQIDASINPGQIYNREIARHWRVMEDRGGPTQNHHDHCHVSFNKTAAGTFPNPEEDDMPSLAIVIIPPGGEASVPVPPPNNYGWGDIWISLSTDENPGKAGVWIFGGDKLFKAVDNLAIPQGRKAAWHLEKGVEHVQVRNRGARPLGVLVEAKKV